MSRKTKRVLLTLTEVLLCLGAAGLLLLAGVFFNAGVHLPGTGIYVYFAPERLAEAQARWYVAGGVYAAGGLALLGGEAALRFYRRKQRRNEHENQTTDKP